MRAHTSPMGKRLVLKLAAVAAVVAAGVGVTLAVGGGDSEAVVSNPHGPAIAKAEFDRVLNAVESVSTTASEAELAARGEALFNSSSVAKTGESCAACHVLGGGVNPALGLITHPLEPGDFTGPRDAPALWNVADTAPYNWVGSAATLEEQAVAAITTHFKPENLQDGTARPQDVAALVAFMKTIRAPVTRQDQGRLTARELRGEEIFVGKGTCIICHGGPSFTDNQIHVINVPEVDLPGKETTDPGSATVRATVDGVEQGGFNTPQLRDMRNTAPYMHNGAFQTLEEVVDFYNTNPLTGGPLQLTPEEKADLVAYLEAL